MDDGTWMRLHEVRVRGRVEHTDDDATRALLDAGFVHRAGRHLVVTAEGRAAHATWARAPQESEPALRALYDAFLPLNTELLRVCHDWQHEPGDRRVLDRFDALDERARVLVRRACGSMSRFERYRSMLAVARDRVASGDTEWFTSPRLDSYHTVWMQLHEDLLLALGLERGHDDG